MALQGINISKDQDIAKTVALTGEETAAREALKPAFDRKDKSDRVCMGSGYCLICSVFCCLGAMDIAGFVVVLLYLLSMFSL